MSYSKKHYWFSFFCLLIFGLMLGLGTWQIQRLEWKTALIEKINTNTTKPAIKLSDHANNSAPSPPEESDTSQSTQQYCPKDNEDCNAFLTKPHSDNLLFRRLIASGQWLHDHEIHIGAKYNQRDVGYYIITPFRISPELTVFVNRGWVPTDKRTRDSRPELTPKETTIEGVIWKSEEGPWFAPQNDPQVNVWFWPTVPQMTAFLQRIADIKVQPVIIRQTGPSSVQEYPMMLNNKIKLRNDHLQYAFTWYALAVVVLVMYFFYHRSRQVTRRNESIQ